MKIIKRGHNEGVDSIQQLIDSGKINGDSTSFIIASDMLDGATFCTIFMGDVGKSMDYVEAINLQMLTDKEGKSETKN